jgi:hypothetical protein
MGRGCGANTVESLISRASRVILDDDLQLGLFPTDTGRELDRMAAVNEEPPLAEERQPLLGDRPGQGPETGPSGIANVDSEQGTFSRNLGTVEAFAIVISIVIGSGVFTSPGSIDTNVPSPGAALLVWLVGGVLAWTGASTLAELGTAIPGEGKLLSRVCRGRWALTGVRRGATIPEIHLW